jgi:HK97 family phage major capsid protein
MTLKEKLAALKKELAGLTEMVKSGDDSSTKRAKEIVDTEIPALEKQIADANEKHRLLDAMKSNEPVDSDPHDGSQKASAKTLGQAAAAAVKSNGSVFGKRFTVVASGAKAATDPNTNPAGDYKPIITEFRPDIQTGPRRQLTVADLFSQETTNATAVTYFVEGAVDGAPTTIAEGGAYPQIHSAEPTAQTDALKKLGCFYKDTDELLADTPRLAQSIDNRANYLMDITEEDQLLAGDGTGNNILGLLHRSGLQTATVASLELALLAIKHAKVLIKKNTPGFRADGLLLNDEDWDLLTNLQDANKQFLAGGPFYGAYSSMNSNIAEEPPLWGLRPVPTQAVAAGTIVIGAFALGGSVIRKGGRSVEMTNSDGTDFEKGMMTIRPSERLALAIRYPAAFMKLTVSPGA